MGLLSAASAAAARCSAAQVPGWTHPAAPGREVWRFLHDVHVQSSIEAPGIDLLEQRNRCSSFVRNEEA